MSDAIQSVLMIDYENVGGLVPVKTVERWLAWFEDGQYDPERRPRTFAARRIYYTNIARKPKNEEARQWLTFVECPRPYFGAKNVVDMALILDVAEMAFHDPSINEFVILSRDRDYLPLLGRLRQMGRRTVALAHPDGPGIEVFQQFADIVLTDGQLKSARQYVRMACGA
jgi:hypothetical protein